MSDPIGTPELPDLPLDLPDLIPQLAGGPHMFIGGSPKVFPTIKVPDAEGNLISLEVEHGQVYDLPAADETGRPIFSGEFVPVEAARSKATKAKPADTAE